MPGPEEAPGNWPFLCLMLFTVEEQTINSHDALKLQTGYDSAFQIFWASCHRNQNCANDHTALFPRWHSGLRPGGAASAKVLLKHKAGPVTLSLKTVAPERPHTSPGPPPSLRGPFPSGHTSRCRNPPNTQLEMENKSGGKIQGKPRWRRIHRHLAVHASTPVP